MVCHYNVLLTSKSRGFHLITEEIINAVGDLPENGLLSVFIQHTSAALTINENADPSVRVDFNEVFDRLVPENEPYYTHTYEGPDDMPAHIKSSLLNSSVTIPIVNRRLALGTWQGIYLCEFRNRASGRKLLISIYE